jgi:Na+-transporting NADH:ubiquinone oxidoreductase subunit C
MVIYRVIEDDITVRYILPIYGMGLWSTMYGFIALNRDLSTIDGFTFYEHAETPGLGGEIDNPGWKRIWIGKQAFDSEGKLRIHVIKNHVDAADPDAVYTVDGLSGSTLTTRGVDQTVRFWLGEGGYGSFIRRLREEG